MPITTSGSSRPGWGGCEQAGVCVPPADVSDRDAILELASGTRTSSASCTSPRRRGCGTRWSIPTPMCRPMSWATWSCWRRRGGCRGCGISSMPARPRSMARTVLPFRETDRVDTPISLYAATKRADELMSHAYAHLFGLPQTGLRFFTVYGPWGRPDMAYFSFARAIVAGEPITLYEGGALKRDFTYIDDIVAGVVGCLDRPPEATLPARVLNIGNHRSEEVRHAGRAAGAGARAAAIVRTAPRPPVDVEETFAAVDAIAALTGFPPSDVAGGRDSAVRGLVPGVARA